MIYAYTALLFGIAAFFPLGGAIGCEGKKRFFTYLGIFIFFTFLGIKSYNLTTEEYPLFIVVMFIIIAFLLIYLGYKSARGEE